MLFKNRNINIIVKTILFIGCTLFVLAAVKAIDEIGEYPDKIWLHRCNSMEKLYEKHEIYPNIEVDVVFRGDDRFDVTHDIDKSYELNLNLYFAYMQKSEGKIWLDIKNMTVANSLELLNDLNKLIAFYEINKNRLIIESSCWQALRLFTENGYYTSLYVIYDKPSHMDKSKVKNRISDLQEIIDKKVIKAISFPYWWYADIKKNLNSTIDLLTWKHRSSQFQLLLSPIGKKMLCDPQLKVILVKDKGHYHR